MITENQALEIAREANCLTIPKSNGVEVLPPNFTRALNLAAAMALEEVIGGLQLNGDISRVKREAKECRQAAKGEMK